MSAVRVTLILLAAAPLLSGCVVAAATGAVVKTTGAVVGTAAKTTGKVVGAAIPDGDEDGQDQAGYSGGDYGAAPASGGGYTRADAVNDARNLR